MKRKEFLKKSAAFATGAALIPLPACKETSKEKVATEIRTNWAGNYSYRAPQIHYPRTVEEVQSLLKESRQGKALGSRHCFNNIADSPLSQISTRYLNQLVSIDKEKHTVIIQGGVRYGDISPHLHQQGYALHNLASLPHITVAGACATATHGSGDQNGNMPTAVSEIELVTADGSLLTISRDYDEKEFNAMIVGLGAFGIITKLTLDLQPTFMVRQDLFQDLPLESLADNFDSIMSAGYSVSLFTDWLDQKISQVWVKRRTDHPLEELGQNLFGARAAERNLHPITELSAENCTEQMGVKGPWWNRLPHFKMGFTPSSGEELQSEYFVPRTNAVEAILALEKKRDLIYPQLQISELRSIAADTFWMSPCYQQDSIAIHFTWKANWPEVRKLLPMIENELAPFNVKPHWGKLFTLDPKLLRSRYERFDEFRNLVREYDPGNKFANAYLDLNINNS